MTSHHVGFTLLAIGLAGLLAGTRRPSKPEPSIPSQHFVLDRDLPSLGLRRGEQLAVLPDAPIRLGEVVALKGMPGRLVLARYHDELMHCVAGLVHPVH